MKVPLKSTPWYPTEFEDMDYAAFKALATGTANEAQQLRCVETLLYKMTMVYDLSYRPDSSRDTDFAEGKRFVGLELVKLINVTPKED